MVEYASQDVLYLPQAYEAMENIFDGDHIYY